MGGIEPPFLYEPVQSSSTTRVPYHSFDPKAVSRASFASTAPRPKQNGPLVSFNQHPDSYQIPYSASNATPMSSSVKSWVKWTRILQLVLRCLEIIASAGLLTLLILIRGMDNISGWIMRIAPGLAVAHTIYGIYHLGRNTTGRTPASSASYNLFAALLDVTIIPFYAFTALAAHRNIGHGEGATWSTILSDQDGQLLSVFTDVVFYDALIGGGLFLVSLCLSLCLAVTFRKISHLPPDMNPLEDNLTSRHKRTKSEMSTSTGASEKRISLPLESNRSSGAPYEDLSRPPSIPFFHTRSGSTDSFSTYKSTPPGSRDSRLDLPSRQYQIETESSRNSLIELKRASYYDPTPPAVPKRASYNSVPASDISSLRSYNTNRNSYGNGPATPPKGTAYSEISLDNPERRSRPRGKSGAGDTTWYTRDSLPKRDSIQSRDSLPRTSRSVSPQKTAIGYKPVHQRVDSFEDISRGGLPNPLEANPPSPRLVTPPTPRHTPHPRHSYRPSRDSPLAEISNNRVSSSDITDLPRVGDDGLDNPRHSKHYGELRPGTPPIMIGGKNRQVSSGTDFQVMGGYKVDRRDVSGKVAEEGRGGGWGTRFRKISGI